MEFFAHWKSQIDSSMQEFARLAATTHEIDFRYGLLATALLWPIRTQIQEFDGETMDAVRKITGAQTKHILKIIQSWDDDPIAAARALAQQAKDSPEIALALSAIINRFDATAVFAGHLAQVLIQMRGGGDIYNISEQIKAALVNIGGVMNIQSLAINLSLPKVPVTLTRERHNELKLLQKVRNFWVEGVLECSLYGAALLELNVQTAAGAVDTPRPWDMILDLPDKAGENALPPSTRVVEVFDGLEKEGDRTLLILGEPGSGKTITLLELARGMLTRAEQESGHPLPVVFNLSAWGEKSLPFDQWLVEDLNQKYQIPPKIGRMWLENQALLLLLDGLDEVRTDLRNNCVEAINTFRLEHGLTPIVVCSRIQEYEVLRQHLRFQRAIRLLPLTPEQIEAYIQMVGEPLVNLRLALTQDQTLRELARSPLMLNVMSLAYRDLPAQALLGTELQSTETRREHLFGMYVKRMFQRRSARDVYSPSQMVNWLSLLARNMLRNNQSIFSLETIQPAWLSPRPWRWMYLLLSRLIAGIGVTGVILALFAYLLGNRFAPHTITFGMICAALSGVALAGVDALWLNSNRYFPQAFYYFLAKKREDFFARITLNFLMFDWVIGGLAVFLFLVGGIGIGIGSLGVIVLGLGASPFALIFGLRVGLNAVLLKVDVRTRENLNFSWHRFWRILIYASILPGVLVFSITQIFFLWDLSTGLILWNARDGSQVKSLSKVRGEIAAIEFSLDAERLVSTGRDGSIQLWNGQSGDLVKTLVERNAYESQLSRIESVLKTYRIIGITTALFHTAVFSPDRTRLVTAANDMKLRFWNGETGQPITTQMGHTIWINTAVFSPDGTRLVTANADGILQLWDGKSGVSIQPSMGQNSGYGVVIFSPNGARLVTVNSEENLVQLWDARTGEPVKTLKMQVSMIGSVVFNFDGTRLATSGVGPPELWDGQTGELIKTLEGNSNSTIAFNADGTRLVTTDLFGPTQLWDGQTGELLHTLNQDKKISPPQALFSPDGARLVTFGLYDMAQLATLGSNDIAQLWDVESGELVKDLNMGDLSYIYMGDQKSATVMFTTAMFNRDGTRLVTTYNKGATKLWNGQTGQLMKVLEGHTDQVNIVAFSSDGTRLMTAGRDGIVQLWDARTGKQIKTLGRRVSTTQLSPDGMRIATAKILRDDYRGWTFLAIISFLFGCLVSFQTGVVETKTKPNQGIHLTARNALIVALFVAGLVFITVFMSAVAVSILSYRTVLQNALAYNFDPPNLVFYGILSGTIALLVFLGYGGLDVLYHYTLRFLLILQRCIPIRYEHFLDYASERIFLQKVGGSYIFTHRLLLEYFASLDEAEIADLAK